MSAARCLKLALLLSLIPLALRATSLLLSGHAVPATAASSRHSWTARRHWRSSRATATVVSAVPPARDRGRPYRRHATHRRRTGSAASSDGGTRRLRQAAAAAGGRDSWFEDDKRLAPTGSNPLHNLR
ncbi:hypothetical protein BDA96_03G054900 [Sorghum bicolor]|jgi:hypothetical protein|uniref:Uncharacterized protein n=2 Tax=Sorghum bicolor TaxID=4558 RepID=A0A921UL91_SORBI|nr:uncharacterized protein LOC110434042 [Sorghum bicolor]KAG0536337.1 hypothetical protein BDA96_03G054900 [Sorghum bicolor]KXG31752.1 hypothetical protein SORBI_3003G051300 [Sorghum bicolor]|eukprot:XP_021313299.1 uncharacterized protein LOC110434042 [Sorghum bicolor]